MSAAGARPASRRRAAGLCVGAGLAPSVCLLLGACSSGPVHTDSAARTPPTPAAPAPLADDCPRFAVAPSVGALTPPQLVEASGLAASRKSPGVLWTHNDSDLDGPFVYAFAADDARYLGRWRLDGAVVRDWEDMAIGPGPDGGDALYVGDFGDNLRRRPEVVVYRVPEPAVDLAAAPADHRLEGVEALAFTYPGGQAHNAEALLVDPVRGDMCIVTKRFGAAELFCAAAPLRSGVLTAAGPLAVAGLVTGGAVSLAGDLIAVRTYLDVRLWRRDPARPLAEALRGPGCDLPVALERQGEAITFAPDGRGYYTVSEGPSPTLHAYVRR